MFYLRGHRVVSSALRWVVCGAVRGRGCEEELTLSGAPATFWISGTGGQCGEHFLWPCI